MSYPLDPFLIPVPQKWNNDPELSPAVNYLWKWLHDAYKRLGGANDAISDLQDSTLYDVGIKGAEIAEINKAIEELRIRIAFLDGDAVTHEILKKIDELSVRIAFLDAVASEEASSAPAPYGNSIEHDFGSDPIFDASFTITDAEISATSIVLVTPGGASTGRTADDWQWDGATVGVAAGSGSATCYVTFHPGPIVGPRKFNYTVI